MVPAVSQAPGGRDSPALATTILCWSVTPQVSEQRRPGVRVRECVCVRCTRVHGGQALRPASARWLWAEAPASPPGLPPLVNVSAPKEQRMRKRDRRTEQEAGLAPRLAAGRARHAETHGMPTCVRKAKAQLPQRPRLETPSRSA